MKQYITTVALSAAILLTAGTWVSAQTIFQDTFEQSIFLNPPLEEDINLEIATRQAAGSVTSTYTEAGSVFIQDDSGPTVTDSLVLRTLATDAVGGGAAVDLDHDFGPSLAGAQYTVSYDGRVDHSAAPSTDNWQSLGIGDTGADGPNGASADFGILFRLNGDWSVWLDGTIVVGSGLGDLSIDTGIRPGTAYSINYVFDETLASPTVTATVDATLGPILLGTLALDNLTPGTSFEGTSRFFELRAHQGTSENPLGELIDVRLDNLKIELGAASTGSGDFDGDGDVDADDLALWQSDYATNDFSDADGDFDSDGSDFLIWQQTFTGQLSSLSAVPEPTSSLLFGMGCLGGCLVSGLNRRNFGRAA